MKRVKDSLAFLLIVFSWLTISVAQTTHEKIILPPDQGGPAFLNDAIVGDTLANGSRTDLQRVYVLKRDGIYKVNAVITNTGYPVIIKSEPGTKGYKPTIFLDNNPTTQLPPGQMISIKTDINLSGLIIGGYYEPVPANLTGLQGALFNTATAGVNIIIDDCILTNTNGNHIRTDQAPHLIKITNTIFGNMGYLGRSNLGAGKGIDVRAGSVDSLIIQNCSFINWQDRVIRHFSSTAPIKYLFFDHNTLVNGMSYHGLLSLGKVGYDVVITNNMLSDAFALGADTDATRQAEFTDSQEKDQYGGARMTWVITSPNDTTKFTIKNNYYSISAAGQAFYDKNKAAGVQGEGSPLTYHINKKLGADSTKAFIKLTTPVAFTNAPKLMTAMMDWYRSPTGANKTKLTTTWNASFDYDRRSAEYWHDTLNLSYPKTSPAYTGGTDGKPVGAQRWSQVTAVEKVPSGIISSYTLDQNYPNPFNPSTKITYAVPENAIVTLSIYNSLGQEIARLINGSSQNSGRYSVTWNGKDSFGRSVSSGIYFYQLKANNTLITKKMQMIK
ncbi:MAG: FlgD immunoglobulin-like domain containing protein [Syntrophothermus sp.]